ncbi:MAG: hypothetical protein ACRENQ_04440 [Gemmatimonadaceae bacterium]
MHSRIYISGRAFAVCAVLFLVAAAIIAIINARAPFAHGWWLVAYLGLVGGVSQLLLAPGLIALGARGSTNAPALRYRGGEFALWNVGTVIVAVADLATAAGGVLVGVCAPPDSHRATDSPPPPVAAERANGLSCSGVTTPTRRAVRDDCLLAMPFELLGDAAPIAPLHNKVYGVATAHTPPAAYARKYAQHEFVRE